MENNLTDHNFWKNFWEAKKDTLIFPVTAGYMFSGVLSKLIAGKNIKTAIELGGFPGYYSVYFKKYHNLDITLFDHYIHRDIVNELLRANGLTDGDITMIEADMFTYKPEKQYDLVTSFGLIEHFNDTKDIIEKHLQFLKPGGVLFITLPNFKSANGWVQRRFDPENYKIHNITVMDPQLLTRTCAQLGLKEIECFYDGKFSVWLENKAQHSAFARGFVKTLWLAGKIITKIIPVESRALSPYIVLKAVK